MIFFLNESLPLLKKTQRNKTSKKKKRVLCYVIFFFFCFINLQFLQFKISIIICAKREREKHREGIEKKMLTRNSIEKKYKDENLKSLERVAFDACEVLEVDESTFQPFKTLKSIYLANNRLRSISRRLFRGLKSLEDIDLSQNELEAIHPRTFIDQANLTRLSLYFNQIQEV